MALVTGINAINVYFVIDATTVFVIDKISSLVGYFRVSLIKG
jgi:cytochrome c oxidase subunit IV